MAGVLQFVLGMNGSQFNNAVRQSTAETQKLLKASQMVSKAAVEVYDTMAKAKKGMVLDTPGMEKHAGSVRHLRHELSLVGEAVSVAGAELGGLGRLAGLAFNPWLIVISAAVMALDAFKERWEARIEAMRGVLEQMSALALGRMQAATSAQNEAAQQNTAFAISLGHSTDAIDRETEAMERRIALFGATVAGQREVFAAQRAATDAAISASEAAHNISPLQAAQQRNAAENAERAAAQRAEISQMDNEIEEKQRRLAQANQRLPEAEAAHAAAVAAAEGPRGVLNAEKARVEDLRATAEAAARTAATSRAESHNPLLLPGTRERYAAAVRNDQQQLEQARDLVRVGEQNVARLEREQSFYDAAIEKAGKQAAIEQEIKNTYAAQIEQLKQLLDIKKKTQDEENLAKAQEQDARENEQKIKAWGEMRDRLNGRTSFEKMGFHFGGRGPFSANQVAGSLTLSHLHESSVTQHAADHNAQVAANTRQTNQLISQLIGLVGRTASSAIGNTLTNRMP
ncbi:MAG TPA: hypothetical protein VGR14_13020 [Verrucomicrobiae bacterium]|jgi:hypothetical protein|nr:hypothetical protein [Verrucomicrobiae bacterium]